MKDLDNYKKWKDWQRVLVYWKVVKWRHGLTLQALAEITGRSCEELWREIRMKKNKAGGCYCTQIKAPVIVMRVRQKVEHHWDSGFPPPPPTCTRSFDSAAGKWYGEDETNYTMSGAATKKWAIDLMKKYPWPEFKGLRDKKGLANFTPKRSLAMLRKVAQGEVSPWGR